MGSRFTRVQFEQRLDALYSFARAHEFDITALGHGHSGRYYYLVQRAENFVEVTLTSMGGIYVSTEQGMGSQGRISPRLLAWLEGEGLRYECDRPFSDAARDYLSGDSTHPVSNHVPQVRRQGAQEGAPGRAGMPRIRQLLPARPGWFAVYAKIPAHGEEEGFEMRPIIGWALVDAETSTGEEHTPHVAALFVWSALDTPGRGAAPDAGAHLVEGERSGFLGYAFPGCSVEWERLGVVPRQLLKPLLFPVGNASAVDWGRLSEEHRRHYWDEERACWKE